MARVNVTLTENAVANSGVSTNVGNLFAVGASDQGPSTIVKCLSFNDYFNSFGPRSATSASLYDCAAQFFAGNAGAAGYFLRVTDNTATSAALTLNDGQAVAKPTVVVTSLTPGTEGNNVDVTVAAGSGATFTATTASTTALTAISSMANIGVGTPVTGTGIAAHTYISAVNVGASSATLSIAATASGSGVVITPGTVTVTVIAEDGSGDILADETHGPYFTTAQLFADTTSEYVAFTQSAGSGFTVNLPAALSSTALTGGADASDLSDTSYVTTINSFPPELGPGTIAAPGKTSALIVNALFAHGLANNRFAIGEQADATSAATAISALQALAIPATDAKAGIVVQGQVIVVSTSGANQTVPASGPIAALRAQVAASGGNPPPAFANGQLPNVVGFTTAYNNPTGTRFTQADANSMTSAGLCFFGFDPAPCLDEFVTPDTTDNVFDQATAWVACMMLVSQSQSIGQGFKGVVIDGQNIETTALHSALSAMVSTLYGNDVLFGDSADDAASINTGPPVNTPATAQAGQFNAQLAAKVAPYADQINISISIDSLTQSVGSSS